MTLAQGLSFALLGLILVLFVSDRLRFDLVALLVLLLAVAAGIVPVKQAFTGFSNPLLPLIASALVLSAAVRNSGVVESAIRRLRPLLQSHHGQVAVLATSVALLSAVMKNIGALAIFLPIGMQVARRGERSVSELLMPMSFASLVGGMMTLIGTSPNLIISAVRQEVAGAPYAMLDFLPVGAGLTVVAIAFLSFGWRLLPRRRGQTTEAPFRMEDYIGEATLPKSSTLAGKTVSDLEALADHNVAVDTIIRQGDRRYIPAAHWRLYPDDLLILRGDPEDLHKLVEDAKLDLIGKKDLPAETEAEHETPEIVSVEAVVTTNSPMIGRSPGQLRLRERYGVNLLAARSGERRRRGRIRNIAFKEGDLVVLQGPAESINDTLTSLGCLPLAERHLQLGRRRHVAVPLLILIACVAVAATELVPAAVAFTAGAVLIGLLRILSLQEIYDSIEWPILILLGALIPIGEAMRTTGATDLIAHGLSAVATHVPAAAAVGMVLAITMLVTPLLHHAAAVIIMGPVAASLAHQLGLHVDPFLMAVAVGAGSDFLSPIGHQCNTLVMGPGGYRFSDYWHLGLPLSALVLLCGVPLILLVWPLH